MKTSDGFVIHRVLPAACLPEPVSIGPVTFCTTEHLRRYDLKDDKQRKGSLILAENYHDVQGNSIGQVGIMLLRATNVQDVVRSGVPRVCRDALALCYITNGVTVKSNNRSMSAIVASDYFDLLPITMDDGDFTIVSPGLRAMANSVRRFRPMTPLYLPQRQPDDFRFWDEQLLHGFDRAVRQFLAERQKRDALRQVFRAMAIVFNAARQLQETESNAFDLGTRIAQWISAFETLVHPGTGQVGIEDVLALINSIPWPTLDRIDRRAPPVQRPYNVGHKRYPWKSGKRRGMEGAAAHYYRQLHNLRNALAHGNMVRPGDFRTLRRLRGWPIGAPAPLLFRECLMERFRKIGCASPRPKQPRMVKDLNRDPHDRLAQARYDKALARLLFLPQRP